MSLDPAVTRRALLAAGLGGIGIAAVAACSSSGSNTTDTGSAAPAGSATNGARSTPRDSSPASSPAAVTSSSEDNGGASGDELISLDDIKVGAAASVKLPGGKPGIVSRTTATGAVCFSAICTHQGCTVKPGASSLNCPCHGSRFDIKTGEVLNGPAGSPLNKVAVRVENGKVVAT